jgi:hypothetical protein
MAVLISASIGRRQSNASDNGTIAVIGVKEVKGGIVLDKDEQRCALPIGLLDKSQAFLPAAELSIQVSQ